MKKYLLPETGAFFKANLHCHTTFSDGNMTPQDVKDEYTANGYSVVAFTDHDVLIPHPELNDDKFLALNGFEIEAYHGEQYDPNKKCAHLCFVALEQGNDTMPFWYSAEYSDLHNDLLKYDRTQPPVKRNYDPECINNMIRLGSEAGFFVTYNHPAWSKENHTDICRYEGFRAMEIFNYGCWEAGYPEYSPQLYDALLADGRKIYCIASDDNHRRGRDTCGGWIMIKAEKLEYRTITKALEDGKFYASWGPEIKELWFEDGKLHVKCSEAVRITCNHKYRRGLAVYAPKGETITEAVFEIPKEYGYVRLTVVDERGRCADTNAYDLEELYAE